MVASLHLKVVEDGIRQKLILPDKSIIWAGGWVDFLLTCGEYVRRISARVFPSLYKELILGIAAACPPLKPNPPSKLTVKAQFLCEQETRVSQ